MISGNIIKDNSSLNLEEVTASESDGRISCVFAIRRTTTSIRPIWERTEDRLIDGIRDIPALPTPHKWTLDNLELGPALPANKSFIGLASI